jgi:hypothetical protein
MRGFGGGSIVEIIAHHRGDTWRALYTVRFAEATYVLHAFEEKSKRGIATTERDIELIPGSVWRKPSDCIEKGKINHDSNEARPAFQNSQRQE